MEDLCGDDDYVDGDDGDNVDSDNDGANNGDA